MSNFAMNERDKRVLAEGIADSKPFQVRVGAVENSMSAVADNSLAMVSLPSSTKRDMGIDANLVNNGMKSLHVVELNDRHILGLADSAIEAALKVEVSRELLRVLAFRRNPTISDMAGTIEKRFTQVSRVLYGTSNPDHLGEILAGLKAGMQMALMVPQLNQMAIETQRDSKRGFRNAKREISRISVSRSVNSLKTLDSTNDQLREFEDEDPLELKSLDLRVIGMRTQELGEEELRDYLLNIKQSGKDLGEIERIRSRRWKAAEQLSKQVGHIVRASVSKTFGEVSSGLAIRYLGMASEWTVASAALILSHIEMQLGIANACSDDLIRAAVSQDLTPRRIEDKIGKAMEESLAPKDDPNIIDLKFEN